MVWWITGCRDINTVSVPPVSSVAKRRPANDVGRPAHEYNMMALRMRRRTTCAAPEPGSRAYGGEESPYGVHGRPVILVTTSCREFLSAAPMTRGWCIRTHPLSTPCSRPLHQRHYRYYRAWCVSRGSRLAACTTLCNEDTSAPPQITIVIMNNMWYRMWYY